ncbi:MAG: type IV pilus assembly protein PilM [Candidatus Paceibacterota bacterium]
MFNFSSLFSAVGAGGDTGRVVGIDLGSSSIKVVELQSKDEVLTLTTYGEIQLGPYGNQSIGQSITLDSKQEQQALVDILRESAVKATSAVFAMPLNSSFVTSIHLEAGIKEDLAPRVRIEARKYIPVPINEVTLDWAEIGSEADRKNKQRDILIAAIQNEALNRFKILMQFVNLKQPPTEIECFSAIRGAFNNEEKHVAVIDIGAVSAKLYLSKEGLLQRMHRVRAGGAIATKRIASTLDIPFDEAEVLKRTITKEDGQFSDVQRAHHSCYERPIQEFRQVIKEYEETSGAKLDAVYLAGSASLFPTTKQYLADTLRYEVRFLNPFNKVAYPAFMEDMMSELGPTFHVALGAALRSFE